MYLKLMGPENAPDADPRKSYRIHEVRDAEFYRNDEGLAFVYVTPFDGEGFELPVVGNVYLMNADGKTISSFGSAGLSAPREGVPSKELETGEYPAWA